MSFQLYIYIYIYIYMYNRKQIIVFQLECSICKAQHYILYGKILGEMKTPKDAS